MHAAFRVRVQLLRSTHARVGFEIGNRKSTLYNSDARVAKLADAPDLGFRNRRFQNIPFRFKKQSLYEGKSCIFHEIGLITNGE
jgi:hypothetical protein